MNALLPIACVCLQTISTFNDMEDIKVKNDKHH